MKTAKLMAMVVVATGMISALAPANAEAFIKAGADARWVPVAAETMQEDGEQIDATRRLESTGVGLRVLFDPPLLGIGAKTNFTRHVFAEDDLDFSQIDFNAHLRVDVPTTDLAFFGEAGPALSLDIGGFGYNATVGAEYDVLGLPILDVNLGVAAQYARVPIGQDRDHESLRAMAIVGVDISPSLD